MILVFLALLAPTVGQGVSRSDVIVLARSCVQEVDDYKQCLDAVKEDIDRRFNGSTEKRAAKQLVTKCLTQHGCRDPGDQLVAEGLTRKEHDECARAAAIEAKAILGECVQLRVASFSLVDDQPSLEDDVAELARSEFPTSGPWGTKDVDRPSLLRLAIQSLSHAKDASICDQSVNSAGLRLCLQRVFRAAAAGETPFDHVVEAEQRLALYCSGRDRCRQRMTESCRKYLDDGKAATCRCAKLDLFTKSAQVSRVFNQCANKERFRLSAPKVVDDLVRAYCSPSRDRCEENFPPSHQQPNLVT